MDINHFMKHAIPKIEVGRKIDSIRQAIKSERYAEQDKREALKETFKPVTDKLEEEIGELTDEIKELKMLPAPGLPAIEGPSSPTPKAAIDKLSKEIRDITHDPNKEFSGEELNYLEEMGLLTPLEFHNSEYAEIPGSITKIIKDRRNEIYQTNKKSRTAGEKRELGIFSRYNKRIKLVEDGKRLQVGSGSIRHDLTSRVKGAYTQPKPNAYKITKNGEYGKLVIDLPRLLGHQQLTASKDGEKVLDKIVDFDTIDLLTKRFNGKKKYSPLSRLVFDELNTLGELPIHKTSKKYSKIGSGVVYFNDPEDLLDRLELLGGSIKAGNNSAVNEFSAVAHTLRKLGEITVDQLKSILGKYVAK